MRTAALQLPMSFVLPDRTTVESAPFFSFEDAELVVVDTETREVDLERYGIGVRRGGYIVGASVAARFSDGTVKAGAYAFRFEGGGNTHDEDQTRRWLRDQLSKTRAEYLGANPLYDLQWLHHWGAPVRRDTKINCVQLAAGVLDENRFTYGLDGLLRDAGLGGKNEEHLNRVAAGYRHAGRDIKKNLWRYPAPDVIDYMLGDVVPLVELFDRQRALLDADGQLAVYDLERRLIPVLFQMQVEGTRIDELKIDEVLDLLKREYARFAAEVRRIGGPKCDVNSPATLAPALEDRGIFLPRTPKGKPSVTKEVYEKNKGDALINAAASAKRLSTLISLTIEGSIREHVVNGRIHPTFNQLKGEDENGRRRGSIARLSCENPNCQQIPSRASEFDAVMFPDGGVDLPGMIRSLFLPEVDHVFESSDFSQVEYRLLVHYAVGRGAEEAREKYRTDPGTDYHKFAAELMHIDPEDSKRRKRTKNLNFALCYGAGDDKLAVTFNCSVEEARAFHAEYTRRLPFVEATYKKSIEWAERRGFVETILGRKCRFPFWEPRGNFGAGRRTAYHLERARVEYPNEALARANTYKALNRKLQGSGADIMKKSMVDAYEAGLFDVIRPRLTIHDELDSSVPRTRKGLEASLELKRIMETCVPLRVPLLVKVERGPSWGEVSESYPVL